METNKLRIFIVLSKTESVRKAAEILNMTPSAVSKTLHQLQEDLDVDLVSPVGRGLVLTSEGRKLAKESERLIQEIDDLKQNIKSESAKKMDSPLRIATFEVFSTYFLSVLDDLNFDQRKLILHESLPGELERAVANQSVDVGITYMPVPYPEVEHVKITTIEMGTFKKKGSFENMSIRDLPYVVPALPLQGVPTRHEGLDGWPADSFSRRIGFEVTLMESALELVRQGRCVGYFPTFVIYQHNRKYRPEYGLVRHRIPKQGEACSTDVYLVKRKDMIEDQSIKLASKLIRMGTKSPNAFGG